MKVLLFIQTGDARPKCVGGNRRWHDGGIAHAMRRIAIPEEARRHGADRWWLVECESAEAGRRLIEADEGERFAMGERHGRILAQGDIT